MIESIIGNTPILGSCYGLVKTSINIYTASSPVEAVQTGIIGAFVNCTPPVIKYPILCAHLVVSAITTVSTGGNPIAAASTVNAIRMIIAAD